MPRFHGENMSDQPVNPVCDERFERLDDDTDTLASKMEVHGRTLDEHSSLLADHSRQLDAVQTELRRQGELLLASQTAIANIGATVSAVKEALDKMNGGIMRLIYILVGALIVLAGVTKLADLGIF